MAILYQLPSVVPSVVNIEIRVDNENKGVTDCAMTPIILLVIKLPPVCGGGHYGRQLVYSKRMRMKYVRRRGSSRLAAPASKTRTDTPGSSERREATTRPEVPPPTDKTMSAAMPWMRGR